MKILSLETTSEIGSIAFLENGNIGYETVFEGCEISNYLVSSVENILEQKSIALSQINYFVVSIGPGSWTGTRLGISFVKGLAKGDKHRIYCVTVPHSLFFGIRQLRFPAICLINAYGGKIYVSHFNGRFYYHKHYFPEKISCEEVFEMFVGKEVLCTGPGTSLLPQALRKQKNIKLPDRYFVYPKAGLNGLLAFEKINRHIPSLPLKPYYGR